MSESPRLVVQCRRHGEGEMPFHAALEGDTLIPVGSIFSEVPRLRRSESLPLSQVRLLPPIVPSKVVCVGKNYAAHVKEMGGDKPPEEPLLFSKPSSSVIGSGDTIYLPAETDRVEHEAELAVVIGRRCRRVPRDRATEVILGFTALNDVTARDLQRRDGQWTRAKGFDTFCPLGPAIALTGSLEPRRVVSRVNGETRQDGTTADLIFDIPTLIAHISAVMTLYPGDIIATGTPEGVGPLTPGDTVEVEVEGIGVLKNTVETEPRD